MNARSIIFLAFAALTFQLLVCTSIAQQSPNLPALTAVTSPPGATVAAVLLLDVKVAVPVMLAVVPLL